MTVHVDELMDPGNGWSERIRDRLSGLSAELTELVVHLGTTGEFWNYCYKVDTPWKRQTKALLKADGANELIRHAIQSLAADGSLHAMNDADHVLRELGKTKPPSPTRGLAIGFTLAASWLRGNVDQLASDLAMVARKNAAAMDTYHRPDDDLAGAAFTALGELQGQEVLEELWTLHYQVPYSQHPHTVLVKSVKKAAARLGVPPHELAERTVPRHGLEPDGTLTIGWIGHGALWFNAGLDAVITLHDDGQVTVDWTDETGTTTRTMASFRSPTGYKARHRVEDVDGVRRYAQRIEKTVNEERLRLTGLAAENRTWNYADWTRYYRDHPVTRVVTRTLKWDYEVPDGHGFRPLDPTTPLAPIPATARVRLRPEGSETEPK